MPEDEKVAPTINSIIEQYEGLVRIRHDWSTYRNVVMMRALRAKFDHPVLKLQLLSTGNRTICEHTKRDLYWGDGMEHKNGENNLGRLLMMLRSMYRHLDHLNTPALTVD